MKTTMRSRVRAYLAQRRALGFRLRSEGYLLLSFARYADRHASRGRLTNKLAIAWASLPKNADRHRWARRLEAVRRLAKYLIVADPKTEIPPRHLFGPAEQPYRPFIYSAQQIRQLLTAARHLPGQLRPWTYQTLIGLLACTGLRISEALGLKIPEVDLQKGLLLVRDSKFHQTRWVPLHPTALAPLKAYSRQRQRRFPFAERFLRLRTGHGLGLQYGSRGFLTAAPGDCPPWPSSADPRFASCTCLPSVAALAGQPPRSVWPGPDPLALSGPPSRPRYLLVSSRSAGTHGCGRKTF